MSVASLSYSQQADGKALIFTDTTTYTDPIANYSRKVEIWSGKDATGTKLFDVPFVGTSLTTSQAITADQYWSARIVITGSPSIASAIINFVSTRFEYNLLFEAENKVCGCVKGNCSKTFNGFIDLYLAQVATEFGNSGLANTFITASKSWLNKR